MYLCTCRLSRGRGLDSNNPELLLRSIQLYHVISLLPAPASVEQGEGAAESNSSTCPKEAPATLSPIAARVLAEEAEGLLEKEGVKGAVASLVALAEDPDKGSLRARVCAAQAMALVLGSSGAASAAGETREKAVALVRGGLEGRGVTVKECIAALAAFKDIVHQLEAGGDAASVDEVVGDLRRACAAIFPLAEAFGAEGSLGETERS